jgi:hypothetical protein
VGAVPGLRLRARCNLHALRSCNVQALNGGISLEELRDIPHKSGAGSSVRRRVLLLCVLPTLLLGVTYFLLVEFALRELLNLYEVPPLLRYGGAALAVLFSLVALGVGSMLADGFLRPLRALLRVAEAQDASPGPTAYLSDPDPYLRRLFLRVFTLVQQNRSGAQTLKDLESLRGEVLALRERIRFAASVSSLPTPRAAGGELSSDLLVEMDRFWARLRTDLESIDEKLTQFGRFLGEDEAGRMTTVAQIDKALGDIERLGTVWSLEIERARQDLPTLPGSLGSCFREFAAAIERLRDAARSNGAGAHALDGAKAEVLRLRETIGEWLRGEAQAERELDSSHTPDRTER